MAPHRAGGRSAKGADLIDLAEARMLEAKEVLIFIFLYSLTVAGVLFNTLRYRSYKD